MRSIPCAASLALVLSLGAATTAAAQSAPKLAYIRSQALLAEAPGRAAAEQAFEREMGGYRQAVQRMGDSLNTMIAAYNQEEISLSPAAKETRQKSIRDREEQYQQRVRALEQQIEERRVALMQPIMDLVTKVIEDVRKEGGYAMIFNVGPEGGSLVAADTTLDITSRVLTRLKAATPPTAPAARPTTPASVPAPSGVTRPKPNQ